MPKRIHAVLVLSLVAVISTVAQPCSANETEPSEGGAIDALLPHFTNLNLVGQFTIDRGGEQKAPGKPERYEIKGILPARGDTYLVQARIKYGKNDVTVPVPVKLHEAGPNSVLMSLDDLAIPLLGDKFFSRVVFDFDSSRYAGTWRHGEVGGHMWGDLEHTVPKDEVLVVPPSERAVAPVN